MERDRRAWYDYSRGVARNLIWVGINLNFHVDRLNVTHPIMMRKINFYRNMHASKNCTSYNVFMSFMSSGCDNMCQSVFKQKSLAVKLVKDIVLNCM